MKRWLTAAVLGLSLAGVAKAAIDTYQFRDEAERERYQQLTKELRCPKCQNQDIADSNAPIAADLRREIFRMLGEGKNNQQIVDFMVDRYGDFVRYKPALVRPGDSPGRWFRGVGGDRPPSPRAGCGRQHRTVRRRTRASGQTAG